MFKTKKVILAAVFGALIFGAAVPFAGRRVWAEENNKPELKSFNPSDIFEHLKDWEKNFRLPEVAEIEKGDAAKSFGISASGNVKITNAEVVAVSGNSLSVKSWGFVVRVATDAETRFLVGKLRTWSLAEIKTGDRIDVFGSMNEADGSVTATAVNAKVSAPRIQNEEVLRLRSVVEGLVRQLQEALRKFGKPLPPEISPVPDLPNASPSPETTVLPEAED